MADSLHRSVVAEIAARHAEIAATPMPPVDGYARISRAVADSWFEEVARQLKTAKHHKAYDEQAIRERAEHYANICSRAPGLEHLLQFAAAVGIPVADVFPRKASVPAKVGRLVDCMWWRRQLRKIWTRHSESTLREIGVIRKGKQPYASDAAVEHRAMRNIRTREWMKSREMVSETGEAISLEKLHDSSQAMPKIRRQEFMCRVRGFEEYADTQGHIALFFTLTTPSKYHAQKHIGGINPAWETERARVRDGQQWLCKMWARARAQLQRLGISPYGVRVAEPHHDGTPHWHALLWVLPEHATELQNVLRDFWLSEDGSEPGAQQYRYECTAIDRNKGSAVGYIAKYIAKNVDGAGQAGDMVSDETGETIKKKVIGVEGVEREISATDRVAAWASVHGIRQFQQLGGPPVGLWREFRRLRDPVAPALLESIRTQADSGKWCGYIESLGGMARARRRVSSIASPYRRTLRPPKVQGFRLAVTQWRRKHGPRVVRIKRDARPAEMPAAWLDKGDPIRVDTAGRKVLAFSRYGESPEPRAAAVASFTLEGGRYSTVNTRPYRWRIEKCATSSSDGSVTGSGRPGGSGPALESVRSFSSGEAGRVSLDLISVSRSDLGPVAITVRSPELEALEAMEIERARRALDHEITAYQKPPDIPKLKEAPHVTH